MLSLYYKHFIAFYERGDEMYRRIEAQLVLSGLSKQELAKNLGISYNTLILKLNGKRDFSLDEATEIKRLLHTEDSIEELFDETA